MPDHAGPQQMCKQILNQPETRFFSTREDTELADTRVLVILKNQRQERRAGANRLGQR